MTSMTGTYGRIRVLRGVLVWTFAVLCVGALAVTGTSPVSAAPQPNPVPERWQLLVEPGPLRVTAVETDEDGLNPYLYFTYKVTNTTGKDQFFAPSFELWTDNGEITRSGRNVPRGVYETLLDRLRNPLLENELSVLGVLREGKEHAKEGLVVWQADDMRIDDIKIFASGFSGETKKYVRPDTGEEVTLRKQLMLVHHANGELDPQSNDPIPRVEPQRWIMR